MSEFSKTSLSYSQILQLHILVKTDLSCTSHSISQVINGNLKLCVVEYAKVYIEIRNELVPCEIKQFLVAYEKPHKAASDDSVSRWINSLNASVALIKKPVN